LVFVFLVVIDGIFVVWFFGVLLFVDDIEVVVLCEVVRSVDVEVFVWNVVVLLL